MGSYKWGYRVPLRVLWGSIRFRVWRVVISGVTSRITIIITHLRGHVTPLITTHEPPSKYRGVELVSENG